MLSVNLRGVVHGIRAFVPHLVAQGRGHVVNTASMAGVSVAPGLGPYMVSKHGVVALSEGLAADLALAGVDVGVTVVCPGGMATNISTAERNRPVDLQVSPRELDPKSVEVSSSGCRQLAGRTWLPKTLRPSWCRRSRTTCSTWRPTDCGLDSSHASRVCSAT